MVCIHRDGEMKGGGGSVLYIIWVMMGSDTPDGCPISEDYKLRR